MSVNGKARVLLSRLQQGDVVPHVGLPPRALSTLACPIPGNLARVYILQCPQCVQVSSTHTMALYVFQSSLTQKSLYQ